MGSQDVADQDTDFFKTIDNEINQREEKFIGFLSDQLGSLTENIIQSILNVASVIEAGFLLELQDMKMKRDILAEKMKSFNLEHIDKEGSSHVSYQSSVDHAEVKNLIDEVKSIIESTNNQDQTTFKLTNQVKSTSETTN